MVDILHKVGIKAPAADVFAALTTLDGLNAWWTNETTGEGAKAGGVLLFRFGGGGFDMKVLEATPDQRVLWEVIGGPDDWLGTTVSFDLSHKDGYTTVLFNHAGWREPVEFMHHCSTKWAVFLLSLKSLLETGKGQPFPNDVQVAA